MDQWRWYNMKAAINFSKRPIRRRQEDILGEKIQASRFGRVLKEEYERNWKAYPKSVPDEERVGYRWTKRWYRECQMLSRSDIRILIMLRTGHDRLAHFSYFAHKKGDSPDCSCGNGTQTLHHLLKDCTIPHVRLLRHNIQFIAKQIFEKNLDKTASDCLQLDETGDYYNDYNRPLTEVPDASYFCDPQCYIYPDGRLPQADRATLQRIICHFYKLLRRKNRSPHSDRADRESFLDAFGLSTDNE